MKRTALFLVILLSVMPGIFAEETAQEISIIAKKWEFFPNTITVKKDIPVKIYLTTVDVPHGVEVPEIDVSSRALKKGKITELTFTPKRAGEFAFACTVFCGSGHGGMRGKIIVEE